MIKFSLSGNTIYMYLRLISVKGCDAIRPALNCFDDNFDRIAQWVLAFMLINILLQLFRKKFV